MGKSSWKSQLCSLPAAYLLTNLVSACAIVFANKVVLSVVRFRFTVALTSIHTCATLLAAKALCAAGVITRKRLPSGAVIALAAAFTGYIVVCNVSLALNSVGFYQLTKIAIAPTVLIMESLSQRRLPQANISICVLVVCLGIGLATVFDADVMTNVPGLIVGIVSVFISAQYGVWIGSITRAHDVSSLQLLEQYLPYASVMMLACVPLEQLALSWAESQRLVRTNAFRNVQQPLQGLVAGKLTATPSPMATLWNFRYNSAAIASIAASAALGVLVTFSTFLVIGQTSPLTYAVAGHVKTIVIIGGGVLIFGDNIAPIKGAGLVIALTGVVAYSWLKAGKAARKVALPAPLSSGKTLDVRK